MNINYLIVGAGVSGLSLAEALLLQGNSVTVLERGEAGQESSWAGGGILSPLCPWDYVDAVTQLTSRGATLFKDWANTLFATTGIDPEYEQSGMLVLPPFDSEVAKHWCNTHGCRCEEKTEGLLLPDVAQVRNPRLMRALLARVRQLGGNVIEFCEVAQIVVGTDVVVKLTTSRGDFQADNFVVTAGAWSKVLLGELALNADIKPMRGQILLFKFDAPPISHILFRSSLYLIPRRDGHLLVGSTLEDAGFDKSTTIEARESLLHRAVDLLPDLIDMPLVKHWAGLRPGSPDNIPTIGRHPYLKNLYINSGHFRYGVTMAPASVEVLMNQINGTPQQLDASPYRWL